MPRHSDPQQFDYPIADVPPSGEVTEVADGVLWLRMPLPFALDHINLYLLRDGDGWAVVDTGVRGQTTFSIWERVFETVFAGGSVTRVIATHMHPDHVGQAGWLTRHFGVDLWMTRTEFLMCRMLAADGPADVPEDAIEFYRRAGYNAHQLALYQQRFGRFGALIEPMPSGFRRIVDGDTLVIGDDEWHVVVGRGHSPEHACLFAPERGLLLSGDQVLPRISSNVSVFPTEPRADPLRDWLESCNSLPGRLPADVLVLPSHNEPFYGLHRRLGDLIDEHLEALVRLHALCAEPMRVVDVFPALFKGEITDEGLMFATGEAIAHLNYLLERGAIVAERGDGDAIYYVQSGPFAAGSTREPGPP
jgi:glyoxylase-like metal-dependent hydrolase (beta-lactamase superfamily II)